MGRNSEELVYTPLSLLDTDLYQFTIQQAIAHHFPETQGLYRFTLRDSDVLFPRRCIDLLHKSIQRFQRLRLTAEEKDWLARTCPYFSEEYLEYLSEFRFSPAQISIKFFPVSDDGDEGRLELEASGLWRQVILWEVPLGVRESASAKAQTLIRAGCTFMEFGTQRRRSFYAQELVVEALKRGVDRFSGRGNLFGTSNAYFAKKYNIHPVGTVAHEWFMGVAALKGYEGANANALALWQETYPQDSFIALTDTFSTKVFFQACAGETKQNRKDPSCVKRWTGLRQDSGDPFEFALAAKAMYESIGIDIRTKTVVFSDALIMDRVLQLKKQCDDTGVSCSFGIGTFITNDSKTKSSGYKEKSKPLNMVTKLAKVDDRNCVKITDDWNKNTGDKASVEFVKKLYGLPN